MRYSARGLGLMGIYAYFRGGQPISGVNIRKPTGSASRTISVGGQYSVKWRPVAGELHYSTVSVSGAAG